MRAALVAQQIQPAQQRDLGLEIVEGLKDAWLSG
jgi:hypothetical protein